MLTNFITMNRMENIVLNCLNHVFIAQVVNFKSLMELLFIAHLVGQLGPLALREGPWP